MEKHHPQTDHDQAHLPGHAHGATHGAAGAHPAVSRRTALILGGTALVAAAIPAALFLGEPEGAAIGARQFIALLADPAGAAELGEIWFEEGRPGEALPVYEVRFADRLRAQGWTPRMTADETHRLLARAVRNDYATRRTVSIRDWHLSETEADLCALAALHARTTGGSEGGEEGEDADGAENNGATETHG